MPLLSQSIIDNVGAEYIQTYLRRCKLTKGEDQEGMDLKYWVDSLIKDKRIDMSDFEDFLFKELFWGKRKHIRFYQLEKINKIKRPDQWRAVFHDNFDIDELDYSNILGSIPEGKGRREIVAIRTKENYKGELEKIQILFSEYIEIVDGEAFTSNCTYFPVEIDFEKRVLNVKAWLRQGITDFYKIGTMMDNLIYFLKSVCNVGFKSYAVKHKKALYNMSQDLINQIYCKIPAYAEIDKVEGVVQQFSQSVLKGLALKNVISGDDGLSIPKGVLDLDDELHKIIEKLCVSDYFYDVPYEEIWNLNGVDAIISKIRFNDVEHVLTSLSGENSSVPIFCTKTFMALKKSLEDSELVERLWIVKKREKGKLTLSYDATKGDYLSISVLSGIRFKEEDLRTAEDIYKQYESGNVAKVGEQDKARVV